MTREEIKIMLPIMQAFAEGKTLQYRVNRETNEWKDINNPTFNDVPSEYRIKPEPTYRSFKTKEECWNEMLKHQPFGWIKYGESICNIHNIYSDSITISACEELYSHEFNISFVNSTFVDGTPFGIKEE